MRYPPPPQPPIQSARFRRDMNHKMYMYVVRGSPYHSNDLQTGHFLVPALAISQPYPRKILQGAYQPLYVPGNQ